MATKRKMTRRHCFSAITVSPVAATAMIPPKAEQNRWQLFRPSVVEKIVITIDSTDEPDPLYPGLFLPDHPKIPEYVIEDSETAKRFANRLSAGPEGKAGATIPGPERYRTVRIGVMSFVGNGERFDVTISNYGFFMGPELTEFYMFYSWTLAALLNDIALKSGPGLRQRGFNVLSGADSIVSAQFSKVCNEEWDRAKFEAYENRPADIWKICPDRAEWDTIK